MLSSPNAESQIEFYRGDREEKGEKKKDLLYEPHCIKSIQYRRNRLQKLENALAFVSCLNWLFT